MLFLQPLRRTCLRAALAALCLLGAAAGARAAAETPNALISRLSGQVLQAIKSDKAIAGGDLAHIMSVVDTMIMPSVDFTRMTASATGPGWRQATPEQRQRLQNQFKTLLVRTYAGALQQVSDQTVDVLPMRGGGAADQEVIVRTLVKGRGDPIQLDYRLAKTPDASGGWKIYDLNVLGVWLVDNYRPQFAQQIRASGIDGLIDSLAARNKANGAGGK